MGQVVPSLAVALALTACTTSQKAAKKQRLPQDVNFQIELALDPPFDPPQSTFGSDGSFLDVDDLGAEELDANEPPDSFDLFFEEGQRHHVPDANGLALDVCREGDLDCVCPEMVEEFRDEDGGDEPDYSFLDGHEGKKRPAQRPSRTDTFVRVVTDAVHAVVIMDGVLVAAAGEYFAVDPGRVRLEVWAEGHQVVVRKVRVRAHEKRDVRVLLE